MHHGCPTLLGGGSKGLQKLLKISWQATRVKIAIGSIRNHLNCYVILQYTFTYIGIIYKCGRGPRFWKLELKDVYGLQWPHIHVKTSVTFELLSRVVAQAVSHHAGPDSIRGKTMWNLWWSVLHWGGLSSSSSVLHRLYQPTFLHIHILNISYRHSIWLAIDSVFK
jgi:hypothetical protein